MAFQAAGRTDTGVLRRENQDKYLIMPEQMVYAVADGMGGHEGGGLASAITVETLERKLKDRDSVDESVVENALAAANAQIHQEALRNRFPGMGTTLVLVFFTGGLWKVAHIGDSRVYAVSADRITAVTKDHSLVSELLARGNITSEEAKVHPHRNVLTRALGTEGDAAPEWGSISANESEYLLLCTDGLFNMLEEEIIQEIVISPGLTLEEKAERLVEEANQKGGTDNITVILITEEGGR
ncbi:MAG: Stp1/IreP family PP2C-type Ser/Thr phosphatase [Clostridiales bacterium]|nr:Stp1/IreP family PP2C-type Ser/Thr phosphatase [Clostridiales bacterium]